MKGSSINTKEVFLRDYGNRDWNWYRSLLAEAIKYGIPGKWVDLGSGLGLFVECAVRFGIDCIGLEGSEWAINEARIRFPMIDMRQHFLEDRLPFEDTSISTIMFNQVIEHISKETAVFMLAECYRVLKHGGVMLIYSPSKYDKKQALDETHINLYTPKSLRERVKQAGFKVVAEPNSLKLFLGNNLFSKALSRLIYGLWKFEFLSNSANIIAKKP
jgi:ubiquinone/menaquinone biosynthesis C-methylase UbiE